MKLTQFAAFVMGIAAIWWRLSSEEKTMTPERWFYVLAAAFAAYANGLALLE